MQVMENVPGDAFGRRPAEASAPGFPAAAAWGRFHRSTINSPGSEVKHVADKWKEALSCAVVCNRCERDLTPADQRILSVYDHRPICMRCKKEEEERPDYEKTAKQAIGYCMAETEVMYSDPGGYCYHHFYPFSCDAVSGP